MNETTVFDYELAGANEEEAFKIMMEKGGFMESMDKFLSKQLPTKDGEDWSEQLGRELGISSGTVRKHVKFPAESFREEYLAISAIIGLNIAEANLFLTKLAKVTQMYPRNVSCDAPYYRLISNREKFEEECPREKGETILDWVRRAMPECFLDDEANEINEFIKGFCKRKGWTLTQIANDTGIKEDDIRHWERRCFSNNREAVLAIAVSLEMTEEETNYFLSMCEKQASLDKNDPLDAAYMSLINQREVFCQKYPRRMSERNQAEPILHWIRRVDNRVYEHGGKKEIIDSTQYYLKVVNDEPLEKVRNLMGNTAADRTSQQKAIPIIQNWIRDTQRTWLVKNAGNRKWVKQGYQNREAKRTWDKVRRALEIDGKMVSRDLLIKLGLLIQMDLQKMNEVLSACGYREIHAKDVNVFETYLYCVWSDFSALFYDDGKMQANTMDFDAEKPIPDLQWFISREIDKYAKPMKQFLQNVENENEKLRELGKPPRTLPFAVKQYQSQQKRPPAWYLPQNMRKKRYCQLRADAILQAMKEYFKLKEEESRMVEGRLEEILKSGGGYIEKKQELAAEQYEKDVEFIRQDLKEDGKILDMSIREMVDYSLYIWGFPCLGKYKLQKEADRQFAEKLEQGVDISRENCLEELKRLVDCLY